MLLEQPTKTKQEPGQESRRGFLSKITGGLSLGAIASEQKAEAATRKKPSRRQKSEQAVSTAPLLANRDSQAAQNRQADRDDLTRLEDNRQLEQFIQSGLLVPLPQVRGIEVKDLDPKWCYCRPWTERFLKNLAAEYYKNFGTPFFVTSAIRTVERQHELRRETPNATQNRRNPSSHLTGATIDITKNGMTRQQILWMRQMLRSLHNKTIYAIEEFEQPCFHVMVYKKYQKPASW